MLSSIIGAAASIAGGLLGNSAAKKAQKAQNAREDSTLVRRVADGKAAGISKMAAIGSPTMSMPAINTGGNFDFLGNAGQNIARAVTTNQSPASQTDALTRAGQAVQVEGLQLDNDIKRAQLASIVATSTQPGNAPGAGGPYAIPGQPYAVPQPERELKTKTDIGSPGEPAIVPGRTPEVMLSDTVSGGTSPILPPAMQEALESQGMLAQAQYFMRNGLMPFFLDSYRPKQYREGARPGYHTRYNPITGEYHQYKTAPYKNPRGR